MLHRSSGGTGELRFSVDLFMPAVKLACPLARIPSPVAFNVRNWFQRAPHAYEH